MSEIKPVQITPLQTPSHITTRTLNLSGTPLPEDIRSIVLSHFDMDNADPEDLEVVYQYILHKSPSADIDDIRATIESLASKLAPNKMELFVKIKDMALNELQLANPNEQLDAKRDIINKEIPGLERQAKETGDWRFYLRAVRERDEIGNLGE